MHLILGHSSDSFCGAVLSRLTAFGLTAGIVDAIFAPATRIDLRIGPDGKTVRPRAAITLRNINPSDVESLFLRASGAIDPAGWNPNDHAYVQAETQAALLAWLTALDCPVVNRIGADLWYRPRNPLLYWLPLLRRAGLTVPEIVVTSDPEAAERFRRNLEADEVPGAVCSSLVRSQGWLVGPAEWAGVAALQNYAPVCLVEPHHTPRTVCIVGCKVIWDGAPTPLEATLDGPLRRFAEMAGLDLVEVTLGRVRRGWAVADVDPLPQLLHFAKRTQSQIVDAVTDLLQDTPSRTVDLAEVP